MNSLRIHPMWISLLVLGATPAFSEVGEFTVSEDLVREMQIVTDQTTPFTKRGRLIRPSIQVQITPTLKDNEDDLSFNLNFDLNGTSRSQSYTPVTRRKGVSANVTAGVSARFQQELTFDGQKLNPGKFSGHSDIRAQNIAVSNNFGLLNRAVNKRARQQAPGQVRAEIPQEKRDLEQKMREEIQSGLNQASGYLETVQKQIHQVFTETAHFPFDSNFSSKSGPNGGIALKFFDKEDSVNRGPKPDFSLRDQIATSGIFHEDLLTKTLSKELAGKEMKIAELQAHLCSPEIASLINFCDKQQLGALGLSIIFDEKEPIKFKFENGKVSIEINAKNRVGVRAGNQPGQSALLARAGGNHGPGFEFEPYQVKISYALKDGSALLEDISVRGINFGFPRAKKGKDEEKLENHGAKRDWGKVWNRVTDAAGTFVADATKSAIEKEFRKLMKEKIEFPIVSFPTKLKTHPENRKLKPEILEASSLVPMELKAENGWFAVSMTLCKENIKPLGVFFDANNRVSTVQPGSPAALAGFQVGDRIESYGNASENQTALSKDINPFIEFIKERSLSKGTTQRLVELSGKSASGVPFTRKVSICPNVKNMRSDAEALLSLGSGK